MGCFFSKPFVMMVPPPVCRDIEYPQSIVHSEEEGKVYLIIAPSSNKCAAIPSTHQHYSVLIDVAGESTQQTVTGVEIDLVVGDGLRRDRSSRFRNSTKVLNNSNNNNQYPTIIPFESYPIRGASLMLALWYILHGLYNCICSIYLSIYLSVYLYSTILFER